MKKSRDIPAFLRLVVACRFVQRWTRVFADLLAQRIIRHSERLCLVRLMP